MNERDLKNIKQELDKQANNTSQLAIKQEEIRWRLVEMANLEIQRYEKQFEELLPQAKSAIGETIQPWFDKLHESGIYNSIKEWVAVDKSRLSGNLIHLTDDILYLWPKRSQAELSSESKKPYNSSAKFILDYQKEDIETQLSKLADRNEVWEANFHIGDARLSGNYDDLYISRWPTIGAGWAFAISADKYHIPVSPNNIIDSVEKISPEVWIGFAQQIKKGKTKRYLNDSLKPKEISTKVEDGNVYRSRHAASRDRYLKNKGYL